MVDFSYIIKYTFTYTINDLISGNYIYDTLSENLDNVNIINAINTFPKNNTFTINVIDNSSISDIENIKPDISMLVNRC